MANTKGSGSTFTGIGKDEPLEVPGGSGEKSVKVQKEKKCRR